MPPYGLYSVPRHHLHGQMRGLRPSFNSMDFVEDEASPAKTDDGEDAVSIKKEKKEKKDKKDKDKKEKKKRKKKSLDAQDESAVTDCNEASSATTPTAVSSKVKISKDKKKEKGTDDAKSSSNKRKRESDAQAAAANVQHHRLNTNSLLGTGFMDGLKATLGNLGAAFDSHVRALAPAPKMPSQNLPTSRSAPNLVSVAQETTKDGASSGDNVTTSGEKAPKKRGRPPKPKPEPVPIPVSKAKPPVQAPAAQKTPMNTPVPLPQQRSQSRSAKTPVPLPQSTQTRSVSEMPRSKLKTSVRASHVLVNETPQSQMGKSASAFTTTPIPFSLGSRPTTASASGKKSKKGPTANDPISSSAPAESQDSPSKRRKLSHNLIVNHFPTSTSLTTTNLQRYTEPLRDEPKPRPRRAGSLALSTSSSASSMSIKDAFLRAAKPYPESDTFLTSEKKAAQQPQKKKPPPRETHDEAGTQDFNAAMHAARATVNFTDETAHHQSYLARRQNTSNPSTPLPCLGQLTGCNAKREQLLRLSASSPSPSALKLVAPTPSNTTALSTAHTAFLAAESLLALSLPARVPIPLGRLDGTWRLFCPTYTSQHIDKYGAGQRILTISRIAGFKNSASYTARLTLPPRPMPFALRSFDAPPHASFRTTLLRTVVEGYVVEGVFLGNGYAVVRMDLGLLLRGKATEESGGKGNGGMMEFLGIRDGARRWVEETD